jgi:hypothetical protein
MMKGFKWKDSVMRRDMGTDRKMDGKMQAQTSTLKKSSEADVTWLRNGRE